MLLARSSVDIAPKLVDDPTDVLGGLERASLVRRVLSVTNRLRKRDRQTKVISVTTEGLPGDSLYEDTMVTLDK